MSTPPSVAGRAGLFIVFEGGDSVGKSTQVNLLEAALAQSGIAHLVTHEPGDTHVGLRIRHLLLDHGTGVVDPRAETLLYAADKAQHVEEVIRPALVEGTVVVCDRYVDSMLAYQGAGRELDLSELERIAEWATRGLRPDLTILLDADPVKAVAKVTSKDRLEDAGLDFHRRVRQFFLDLANRDPEHYLVLEALTTREGIASEIRGRLAELGLELSAPWDTLEAKAALPAPAATVEPFEESQS